MHISSFISLFVFSSIVPALAMSDSQCTRTYIVQPGDFCDKISAAQNVPTYQLFLLNPDIDKAAQI
ncbi:hypothetical protein BGW80DRAFT_217886 [Lactifluus volemus]|nr:hypothetical protein BGW80DRAFT_217886 [Lactifluus volemus]